MIDQTMQTSIECTTPMASSMPLWTADRTTAHVDHVTGMLASTSMSTCPQIEVNISSSLASITTPEPWLCYHHPISKQIYFIDPLRRIITTLDVRDHALLAWAGEVADNHYSMVSRAHVDPRLKQDFYTVIDTHHLANCGLHPKNDNVPDVIIASIQYMAMFYLKEGAIGDQDREIRHFFYPHQSIWRLLTSFPSIDPLPPIYESTFRIELERNTLYSMYHEVTRTMGVFGRPIIRLDRINAKRDTIEEYQRLAMDDEGARPASVHCMASLMIDLACLDTTIMVPHQETGEITPQQIGFAILSARQQAVLSARECSSGDFAQAAIRVTRLPGWNMHMNKDDTCRSSSNRQI